MENEICGNCGRKLEQNAKFCGECGAHQPTSVGQRGKKEHQLSGSTLLSEREKYKDPDKLIFPDGKRKSPGLAVFLSFLFGGLGQIYLGQTGFGVMIVIFDIVVGLFGTVGVGYVIVMVISVIWAYRDAERLNKGEPILKWPRFGGSAKLKKEYR